jgi:PiT family inorganic phosphate transporter
MEWLLILAALVLAFSNGANDNFKGFATAWGAETLNYRRALILATLATVAGSLASLLLAESLVQQFSGKELVPDVVANAPLFIASVASSAAMTVFLATWLGLPVSTTHALVGGLVGAGLAQKGSVPLDWLASTFLMPLLISPMLAAALGAAAYHVFHLRPVVKDCVCVVLPEPVKPSQVGGTAAVDFAILAIVVASAADCERFDTKVRWSVSRSMDRLHVLSAMSICFARGVNDTPKLTVLLLASHLLSLQASTLTICAVMTAGGLLFSRRVAQTMSQRVTRMNHTQGLSANLITAALVLSASKLGLPVSTTHVAVGAIAGVGAKAGTLDWKSLRNILLSWVATLPLAMGLAWSISRIV